MTLKKFQKPENQSTYNSLKSDTRQSYITRVNLHSIKEIQKLHYIMTNLKTIVNQKLTNL